MHLALSSPILALALFLVSISALAQNGRWEYINGLEGSYAFTGKYRSDGTVFLGTSGGLYVLDPGSDHWRMSNGLPHSWIASIAFGKAREIVVSFESPLPSVYRSIDDGASWTLKGDGGDHTNGLPVNVNMCRDAIAWDSASGDIAVGTTSGVYRLPGGSSTWQKISPAYVSGEYYYIDGDLYFNYGRLHRYRPGDSVAKSIGGPSANTPILTFKVAPGGAFYGVMTTGQIWRSTNKGVTWRMHNASPPDVFHWMAFISDQTIVAGFMTHEAYRSNDGGLTWTPANITVNSATTRNPFFAIAGPDAIVAWGGLATSRSLDNGLTFHDLDSGLNARVARMVEGRTGTPLFVAYEIGEFYRYDDPPQGFDSLNADFAMTTMAEDGTLYGGSLTSSMVSRSTNNGRTWENIGGDVDFVRINDMIAARGMLYVASTDQQFPPNYIIWRSSDRGTTWLHGTSSFAAPLIALAVDSLGRVYAGSDSAVYRSIDNGLTFDVLPGGARARGLAVAPNNDVYAGWRGDIHRIASDDAQSTHTYSFPKNIDIKAIAVDTSGMMFVGSARGGVSYSVDRGVTFTTSTDATVSSGIYTFAFAHDGVLYGSTAYSGVVRYKPGETEPPVEDLPIRIYPVPVMNQATVAFLLSEEKRVRIDIYDVLGQRVEQLADGLYQNGRSVVVWDARGFASSAYFIRVAIGDDARVTKVVLIR